MLDRLIAVALSDHFYNGKENITKYQKFQLLLCAAETSLQRGNLVDSISHAKHVNELSLPDSYHFFGHLLMCRAYAANGSFVKLEEEYRRCLELKTDFHVGWICLKILESQYNLRGSSSMVDVCLERCTKESNNSSTLWMAVSSYIQGLIHVWNKDFLLAEEFLSQACSLAGDDCCLFLCHGMGSNGLIQFLTECVSYVCSKSDCCLICFHINSFTQLSPWWFRCCMYGACPAVS